VSATVAILGDDVCAFASVLACRLASLPELSLINPDPSNAHPARLGYTLPANQTRILSALGLSDQLLASAHQPDREQVRLGRSAYLVAELPLGDFLTKRYGAPHINIDSQTLHTLMKTAVGELIAPRDLMSLQTLEHEYDVVLNTSPPTSSTPGMAPYRLWQLQGPLNSPNGVPARANITWVNGQQCAWQFDTANHSHFVLAAPYAQTPDIDEWHPSLRNLIERALDGIAVEINSTHPVRDHWVEGRLVHLGHAVWQPSPFCREAALTGLEDAWVISRMLENYEEDIDDALSSYAKYRRPRTQKIARYCNEIAAKRDNVTNTKRFLEHIGTAVRARFLPEIAMQRIDWLYQYDCIRGFR